MHRPENNAQTPAHLSKYRSQATPLNRFIPAKLLPAIFLAALCVGYLSLAPAPAMAQRLVATANDAPITDYDIRQRIRLLRALREKATAASALESLIEERLKASETKKYSIKPTDPQILAYAARDGARRKIPQQRLAYALQRGGIDEIHWKEYYRVHVAWDSLIAALYKAVNVSAREIDQELDKQGKKKDLSEYTLRQVIFVVPRSAGLGGFNARLREARGLRSRFNNCDTGVKLARSLRDVAVKAPVRRRANTLNPALVKLLARTKVGTLTAPQRGASGVEMLAVCEKSDRGGRIAAGSTIRDELLAKKLKVHSDRRYQDIRRRALIIRR